MKRSKLYTNLINAYQSEKGRAEKRLQTIKKQAQRAVGTRKQELDYERDLLILKIAGLQVELRKAYRIRDNARKSENHAASWTMPDGYQHP